MFADTHGKAGPRSQIAITAAITTGNHRRLQWPHSTSSVIRPRVRNGVNWWLEAITTKNPRSIPMRATLYGADRAGGYSRGILRSKKEENLPPRTRAGTIDHSQSGTPPRNHRRQTAIMQRNRKWARACGAKVSCPIQLARPKSHTPSQGRRSSLVSERINKRSAPVYKMFMNIGDHPAKASALVSPAASV